MRYFNALIDVISGILALVVLELLPALMWVTPLSRVGLSRRRDMVVLNRLAPAMP